VYMTINNSVIQDPKETENMLQEKLLQSSFKFLYLF
jgi:hypothetical protein